MSARDWFTRSMRANCDFALKCGTSFDRLSLASYQLDVITLSAESYLIISLYRRNKWIFCIVFHIYLLYVYGLTVTRYSLCAHLLLMQNVECFIIHIWIMLESIRFALNAVFLSMIHAVIGPDQRINRTW